MTEANHLTLGSNWQIMRSLLAKDWRLYRLPMIALVVIGLACYALGAIATIYRSDELGGPMDSLFSASMIAVNLTAVLATAFGGVAVAGERTDRTADFIAMLPVTRKQIIASKWLVSGFMLAAASILHGVIILALLSMFHELADFERNYRQCAFSIALWFSCMISFFGIAWLLSTFTKSAVISACTSLAVTLGSLVLIGNTSHQIVRTTYHFEMVSCVILLAFGLGSLVAGTAAYLRRVAP